MKESKQQQVYQDYTSHDEKKQETVKHSKEISGDIWYN